MQYDETWTEAHHSASALRYIAQPIFAFPVGNGQWAVGRDRNALEIRWEREVLNWLASTFCKEQREWKREQKRLASLRMPELDITDLL